MIELTKGQLDELATGRVVVAVPCDPQPPRKPFRIHGEPTGDWFVDNYPYDFPLLGRWRGRPPHKPGDKIPTPAGDAIVSDVDVRLNEVWEWVVTLERLENSNV